MDWDSAKNEIKNRIPLVDVVSRYVNLKPSGNGYIGLCPFHSEKTPSFHVRHEGFYKCFGCGKSGDIFTFLMESEKYSFFEAFKVLAKEAGVELPSTNGGDFKVDKEREELYDLYKRVAASLHYILLNKEVAKGVRDYLEDRKISLQTTIDFMLGYMPDDSKWLYNFLQKYNYSKEFLAKSGLFSSNYPEYSLFTGRLVFPIVDSANRVVAFSGRELKPTKAKYINSPQTPIYNKSTTLFGINLAQSQIRKSSQVYLVEGNFDVLSMHQCGIKNCVAPLGTSLTTQHVSYLQKMVTKAYTLFDGDKAGIMAAKKAAKLFQDLNISNYIITLPNGKDPSELLKNSGEDYFQNINKYSTNSFTFLLEAAINEHSLKTVENKEEIIKELIPFIDGFDTQTRKTEAIKELSTRIGVDFISLQKDIINRKFKGIKTPIKTVKSENIKEDQNQFLHDKEFLVLLAASQDRDLFLSVKNQINKSDFKNPLARELFTVMVDCFLRNCFNQESIAQSFIEEKERNIVKLLFNKNHYVENKEDEIIKDSIKQIKLQGLYLKKAKLLQDISSLGQNDPMINELQELEDKIINLKIS